MNLVYVPCLCHNYNLMVKDELLRENEVESFSHLSIFEMLCRIRKLVGLFKHSNKLSAKLSYTVIENNNDSTNEIFLEKNLNKTFLHGRTQRFL